MTEKKFRYIISSQKKIKDLFLEILDYRSTLWFLIWRDIKIRYKQAFLGVGWSILQPLLMTMIFVLFSHVTNIRMHTSQTPYVLYVLTGMILWNVFSNSVNQSAQSIIQNAQLVRKIYFPRIFFVLSAFFVSMFDFSISFLIMVFFMIYFDIIPYWYFLFNVLGSLLLLFLFTIGLGTMFAALNVKYRDVKYIVPFFLQLLFFISPIFYSAQLINSEAIRMIYYINPLSGILDFFRSGIIGEHIEINFILFSFVVSLLIFASGVTYFLNQEKYFADTV